MKTQFLTKIEFSFHGDKMRSKHVLVNSNEVLDDEDDCDRFFEDNQINVKLMNENGWDVVYDWNVKRMFQDEHNEMTYKFVKSTYGQPKSKATKKKKSNIEVAPGIGKSVSLKYGKSIPEVITNRFLQANTAQEFLTQFFDQSDVEGKYTEPFIWNGIKHPYLASGGTRDVFVDPTFSYVIKVGQESYTRSDIANDFNALEVYDYWDSIHNDDGLPKVKTELLISAEGRTIIKQDFLVVMNTSRTAINSLFDGLFEKEWNNVTAVYGQQFGWNRFTQRLELYDTSDAYIGNRDYPAEFEYSYKRYSEKCVFNNYEVFEKIHYRNSFISHMKSKVLNDEGDTVWSMLKLIKKYPFCSLEHQSGILLNHIDKTVTYCGETYHRYNEMLKEITKQFTDNYEYDPNYFMAKFDNIKLPESF